MRERPAGYREWQATYHKKYLENPVNREKAKVRSRAFYRANHEKQLVASLEYQRTHREVNRAAVRRWRKRHLEKARHKQTIENAKRKGAEGSHTFKQWLVMLAAFGYQCVYCDQPLTLQTATRDHIYPISKGGASYISNIVPACRSCNSKKRAKLL